MPRRTLLASIALAALIAGCNTGSSEKGSVRTRALAEGETLGKIERAAPGTAAVEVQTLLSVTCVNGQVIVKTNRHGIFGTSDCTQVAPLAAIDAFVGKTVAITYTNGRLSITNVGAGRLEFAAGDAQISDVDDTP
jgi:hypothetical protein